MLLSLVILFDLQEDDEEERVVHETMDTMDTDDLYFNDTNVDPHTQYKYKIVTTTAKGSVYSFILQNY